MQLYEKLEKQLKNEPNFVTDNGELKKWVVITKAQNYDTELIVLLLADKELKARFFIDVKSVLVFNQSLFIQFLEQKNYLNDSYTRYKNKVGLTTDGKYLKQRNEVALVWPFKDCILEGGQSREEDKREEIFFNEILAQDEITQLLEPKVLTNAKTYDKDGEYAFSSFTRDVELNKKRGLPENTITDNLIIKGNNLLALHSLKKEFAGKVKLIYIDPPYNTGGDSFKYNDSFNHSTWLTFMRNRLIISKTLLKSNGLIFISCDDSEESYLKNLLDEIFDRENFINTIAYERSGSAGIGQGGFFVDTTEFILVYSNDKRNTTLNDVMKTSLLDYSVMKRYRSVLKDEGNKKLIKEFKSKSNGEPVKIYKHENYKIEGISLRNFDERELEIRKSFKDNFNKIFRTTNPQMENSFQHELLSYMDEGLHTVEYIPSRGKYKDKPTTIYYHGNEIFAWLKDSARIEENNVVKENKITTLWSHAEIPKADLANEGGVELKRGKKPEQLLKRIIELSSANNEIVLDFFLGSGTTAAVSMKANRQFIGVEQLNYDENDNVKRMINVVKGEQSGVSKAYNWQGGGSFTYLA